MENLKTMFYRFYDVLTWRFSPYVTLAMLVLTVVFALASLVRPHWYEILLFLLSLLCLMAFGRLALEYTADKFEWERKHVHQEEE